jgi:acetate kinase
MDFFGIELDDDKNKIRNDEIREINKPGTKTKVLIIPTNEELEIAKQSFALIN